MSTTDESRKRPHNETTTTFQLDNSHHQEDGASNNNSNNNGGTGGTNKAQENKRRQILQSNKNWGLREVLVECGLVEFMNEERDGTYLFILCFCLLFDGSCGLWLFYNYLLCVLSCIIIKYD